MAEEATGRPSISRGEFLLHLHPDLLATLRQKYEATQSGGITFENYLSQLLEGKAAEIRLPNYKSEIEARPGRHREPSPNARKKNFNHTALSIAREYAKDPNKIAEIMARMGER